MVYLLILICLFFVVVGLRCSRNNIFSPSVMTGGVWAFSLILFVTIDAKLPDLSCRTLLCIFLWVAGLCLSSLVSQSASYRNSQLDEPSLFIRNLLLLASVAYLPKLYFFVVEALAGANGGNWAWTLRLAALGQGSGFTTPFGGIFVIIWQVTFLIELLCFKKSQWWRLVLISFIYLLFGVVTMSKIIFLNFFLFSCTILYFKNKISFKTMVTGVGVLLVLFFTLQSVRMAVKFSDANDDFFITYVVCNLVSFDTLEPCSALHFGENTFRTFYALFYDLGWSSVEPVDILLKWIEKPIKTNTYSALYPYYVDFGIAGVVLFSVVTGFVYGWLFKKSQDGNNFHILMYAVATNILFMQYAADLFFTSLSGNLKLAFFLFIPFLTSKHNLLVVKDAINPLHHNESKQKAL